MRQIEAFEEEWGGRCYFQAYEFVENGADLEHILDQERTDHQKTGKAPVSDPVIWARHVTWAKVLTAGIAALHSARVVHADLKPANAYLIADPTISAGYQIKLIDMDFSLLADQRAPWHGFQGYIGSDNYRSPEHLVRSGMPGPASDVFTTGLILYELLAGYHPYWHEDQAEYGRRVQGYKAKVPQLVGILPSPADNAAVGRTLHRCLSPNPSERPSAEELGMALKGRSTSATVAAPMAGEDVPRKSVSKAIIAKRLELTGASGRSLQIGVRTEVGKQLVKALGPDSEYWDSVQCLLDRDAEDRWIVFPIAGTANETLVNGVSVTAPRHLHSGDQIAVGRQARSIVKLPITVRGI